MQITLDPEIQVNVRRRANAADLGVEPSKTNVSEIFDLGRSAEVTDIAKNKSALIADAIAPGKLAE